MKVNLNLGPEFGQGLLPFWWQSLRELGVVEIHDGIQYEGTFSRPNTIQLSDLAIFFKCYGVMASSWWDQHNIGLLVSFLRPYFMLDIKNIMKSSTLGHHLINDCTTIPLLLACNEMLLGQWRWMDFFFEGATFQFGTVGDQHVGYQEVAYEVNATQTSHLLQVKGHEDDRSARTTRCFRNGTGYLRSSMNLSIECFHLRSFRNAWGSVHFLKNGFTMDLFGILWMLLGYSQHWAMRYLWNLSELVDDYWGLSKMPMILAAFWGLIRAGGRHQSVPVAVGHHPARYFYLTSKN